MGGKGIAGLALAALTAGLAFGATAFAGESATKATSFPTAANGRIVFTSTRDSAGADGDVFIANADGSGATNLTPGNPGSDSYEPSLSPDGTKIVFAVDPGGAHAHIWVMNVDGTNPVDLTPTGANLAVGAPSFSPDG